MVNEFFLRDGRPFPTKPTTNDRGQPGANLDRPCVRCGGAGGADKWAATGWKCFRCHGHCVDPDRRWNRAYTADQLAKLNATQAKRDATRAAKRRAKADAEQAAADARRDDFVALFGAWIAAKLVSAVYDTRTVGEG